MSSKLKRTLFTIFACLVISLPAKSNTMRASLQGIEEQDPQLTILRLPSYQINSYTLPLEEKVFLFSEESRVVGCQKVEYSVVQLQGFEESGDGYLRFEHFIVFSQNDEKYVKHFRFSESDLNKNNLLDEAGAVTERLCRFIGHHSKYQSSIVERDTSSDLYLAELVHIDGRNYFLYLPNFKNIKITVEADGGAEVSLLEKQQITCQGDSWLVVPVQFTFSSLEGKRLYRYYLFEAQEESLSSPNVSVSSNKLSTKQLCEKISSL